MRPLHPNLRAALAAKDTNVRTLVEAQAEQRSDVLRTKSDLQSADTFAARSSDFPSGNSLTAAAQTVEAAVLANAPAANHLYEAHFRVTINPIVPGASTNTHKVVVAVETDPTGSASWTEQWTFEYEVTKKVGETKDPIIWPSERLPVRVTGFNSSGKVRLKIKSASGPGGWSFSVHGFNLATDGDLLSGVTYHTGPAIDFLDGGGATLADTVVSKISHTSSDGQETDLGGPPLIPEQAPFICARVVWGKDDSKDLAIDRFTAHLNPCVDGVPGNKTVAFFICQPYALQTLNFHTIGGTTNIVSLVPLCDPVRVAAGDGTSAQDYVFSFFDRTIRTLNVGVVTTTRKPRPKSVVPTFLGVPLTDSAEYLTGPTTYWFIWAVKADGTPATNVGWSRNSAVTEVVNGSRRLRTIAISRHGDHWDAENVTNGATPRPVFRCKVECGSYANANLEYTAGGNQIDLGATPTETVVFTGVAAVPDGCQAVFEVRNDADSAWLPFTDGQTAAQVGVSQREEYKVRCRLITNSTSDATPTMWEIGVRDLKQVWLSDLVQAVRAKWSIPDVAELVPSIPEAEIVLIKNGEQDFNDRVTRLLSEHQIGTLSFRLWIGDPARPRDEWLHKDDFVLIDDYDPRAEDVTVIAHSALVFINGALPVYNTTTQRVEPLQFANKTPKQVYEDIVSNHLGADIAGRFRGEPLSDESTLLTKTIEDSDGLTELNDICHIAGSVLSTAAGRLKTFQMFGPGATQAIFTSDKIAWAATSPGLRQRVPRFRAKYNYDTVAQEYGGEARLISGNDILATNLKPSRIDAVQDLRDGVCRWIPSEELAKRVGQRRVDTLGFGMYVWRFRTTEPRPDLEFGDVVAMETDRFFARDPTQTTQRTLKGAQWAIGRIVEHDLEGRELSVWIQNPADIFGAHDAAVRTRVSPKLSSVLTYLLPNAEFETWDAIERDEGLGLGSGRGAAVPHAWSVDLTGAAAKCTKETTPANVFSGSFAAKYSNPDNASNGGWHGFNTNEAPLGAFSVPLRPGVSYTLRLASRASQVGLGQQYRLKIAFNAAESSTFIKAWTYKTVNTYQLDVVTFTVPTNAEPYSKLYVEFNRNNSAVATDFWLDSIRINELVDRLFHDVGDVTGTVTIDWSIAPTQRIRLIGNTSLLFTGARPGIRYVLDITQDGTGGRTLAQPSNVTWTNDTAPTMSSGANKMCTYAYEAVGTDLAQNFRGHIIGENQTNHDVEAAVGSLSVNSADVATTVYAVTGLGFAPKFLFVWWSGRPETGEAVGRRDLVYGFGMASGASARRCVVGFTDDNVATSDVGRMLRTDAIMSEIDGSQLTGLLDVNSFGSDGFELIVDDQFVANHRLHWLAIGGNTFSSVVKSESVTGGTGNQSFTGYGADGVGYVAGSINHNTPNAWQAGDALSIGMATGTGNRHVCGRVSEDASIGQSSAKYGFTGEMMAGLAMPATVFARADHVQFDADGFTINKIDGGAHQMIVGFLKGCKARVLNFQTQTDTTTDIVVTGAGMRIICGIVISHCAATSTQGAVTDHGHLSIGAFVADPQGGAPAQRSQGVVTEDFDAANNAESESAITHQDVYQNVALDGTLDGAMRINRIDADGFTARMTNADPAQARAAVLLIGV